jgi:hypothetical protein
MVTARPNEQLMKTSMPGVAPDASSSTTAEQPEDDSTVVRPRPSVLFNVEVWRAGVRQAVVPMSKPEITIGRGSRSVSVDLPLKGDPEVSRIHAMLARDEGGQSNARQRPGASKRATHAGYARQQD